MTNLTQIFEAYFASNRGPDGIKPDYGIYAFSESPLVDDVHLEFKFKCGRTYCCAEPSCHFGQDWERLRLLAEKSGVNLGYLLTIRMHGIVEEGASFTSAIKAGGPGKNEFYEYHTIYSEKGSDQQVGAQD